MERSSGRIFTEFDSSENVRLVLKTSEFHNERGVKDEIQEFLARKHLQKWKKTCIDSRHVEYGGNFEICTAKLMSLFCLPMVRLGERPIVEAMAMSLPVIATNWSGPTE